MIDEIDGRFAKQDCVAALCQKGAEQNSKIVVPVIAVPSRK